jgi:predicted membrane protein
MKTDDKNSADEKSNFVPSHSGRAMAGLILVVIGGVLLARQIGFDIPYWITTWEVLLIGIGLFLGARKNFRPDVWLVPVFIGFAFLIDDFYPDVSLNHYIWPLVIIFFGVYMILKPKRSKKKWDADWEQWAQKTGQTTDSDNWIDITNVFGGSKRKMVSKDFKGGEITSVFGGSDIDLMQSDVNGKAVIDITMVFGGAKLLVPANWKVRSEIVCIFGGVEDKRPQSQDVSESRTLVLTGTVIFGGVDIKSY